MDLLDYLNLFCKVDASELHILTNKFKTKKFKKGELIITPGDIQRELYFVKSGVQMSYHETDSKVHVIAFTYAPNLCAIPESFSFQVPSKYYLTNLTDSEMDYIRFEDLQQVFDQSTQIERMFRIITETILAGMINRHIELHSETIKQRYKSFCNRSPHLLQLVPHKFIASYLGIDPTNFSKLYNKVKI